MDERLDRFMAYDVDFADVFAGLSDVKAISTSRKDDYDIRRFHGRKPKPVTIHLLLMGI